MRAGKLRQRVIIQAPVSISSSVSDQVDAWKDVLPCSAEVRSVSVKEIFAGQGFVGKDDIVVTVRYDPRLDDMNHRWRIWFDNRNLYITGKRNIDMRDRWIVINTTWDQGDIRIRDEDFDEPLHHTVNVVLPELTDD